MALGFLAVRQQNKINTKYKHNKYYDRKSTGALIYSSLFEITLGLLPFNQSPGLVPNVSKQMASLTYKRRKLLMISGYDEHNCHQCYVIQDMLVQFLQQAISSQQVSNTPLKHVILMFQENQNQNSFFSHHATYSYNSIQLHFWPCCVNVEEAAVRPPKAPFTWL